MTARICIALATLLAASTLASAQSPAVPDSVVKAGPVTAGGTAGSDKGAKTAGTPVVGAFTIDQKGVKRGSAAPAGTADPSARQHKEVNKSRDEARMGAVTSDKGAKTVSKN